jgi:hypothetical protein
LFIAFIPRLLLLAIMPATDILSAIPTPVQLLLIGVGSLSLGCFLLSYLKLILAAFFLSGSNVSSVD